jgi:uncharacterized protein
MIAGPFSDHPQIILKPSAVKEGVLPVTAIYGANASGKTNVLKALKFMKAAVEKSHREWRPEGPIPLQVFRLDEDSRNIPSRFTADIIISGIRYQYGFAVNRRAIQEEWLNAYPSGRKQAWFSRSVGKPIEFSTKMSGENKAIETLTRSNSLYLSAAAQNNHEMLTPIYRWFVDAFSFVNSERSPYRQLTVALCDDEDDKKRIAQLLRVADLGIAGLRVKKEDVPEKTRMAMRAFVAALELEKAGQFLDVPHRSDIELLHSAGKRPVAFPLSQESDGTVAYLSMLGPMLDTLKKGGVLCIDELDASLHPLLAMQIITLFNDPELNTKGAQLIFNTHDINLLNTKLLRRDQIWFTEKQSDGSSQLYPLTDFKPKLGENIESGYLQGRYGAIPFLNPDSFVAALASTNDTD